MTYNKIKAIKYWKANLSHTINGIETLKIAIKSNKMYINDKKRMRENRESYD